MGARYNTVLALHFEQLVRHAVSRVCRSIDLQETHRATELKMSISDMRQWLLVPYLTGREMLP